MTEPQTSEERGPRIKYLLASRIVEQGVLGGATLLLARALGVDAFAPVSVLFVVYSAAVTAADFGLGIAVLRHRPGEQIASRTRTTVRWLNVAILVATLGVGLLIRGTSGAVVACGGVLWAAASEATVAKAWAIKSGRAKQAAVVEILGAAALAVAVLAAAFVPGSALAVVAIGILAKLLVEVFALRGTEAAFAPDAEQPGLRGVWTTVVAAYGVSNIDYLVVGLRFPPAVFSVYLVGFRLANALPAQVGNVAVRVSLVDLAEASHRQATYDRYVRRLALVGVAGAALTLALAPLLPVILGPSWTATVGVVMTLGLAVPWRLVLSISGSLALAAGATTHLVRWELIRIVLITIAYLAASTIGFAWLVGTAAAAEVVATLVYHQLVARRTDIRASALMWPLGAASLVAIVLMASTVSTP